MSVNPAEEETESFNEMGRIARGLGMAGMQIKEAGERKREARERTRERAERQEQGAEAEQQRQAQDRHRDEAEAAKALHKDAYSAQFWKSTSNAHLARSIVDAQDLAAKGHGPANSAYMAFADRVRDLHGLNIENLTSQGADGTARFNALQAALDDHNAAGRLRAEERTNDTAAQSVREEQQAQAEDEAAHDPALREAAMSEAAEAGIDTDDYLDRLSAEDRDALLADPENPEARDARIETATREDAGADADRTHSESHPEEKHYDTAADTAGDDADLARKRETGHLAAAASLPDSQHNRDMSRHLDEVAKRDPQAAATRREALKNISGDAKDYLRRSVDSKAHVRKAGQSQPTREREHVQQR
ncbi:hypothetical protein ACUXNS_000562 [Brevibacterium pityocampae]